MVARSIQSGRQGRPQVQPLQGHGLGVGRSDVFELMIETSAVKNIFICLDVFQRPIETLLNEIPRNRGIEVGLP